MIAQTRLDMANQALARLSQHYRVGKVDEREYRRVRGLILDDLHGAEQAPEREDEPTLLQERRFAPSRPPSRRSDRRSIPPRLWWGLAGLCAAMAAFWGVLRS